MFQILHDLIDSVLSESDLAAFPPEFQLELLLPFGSGFGSSVI